MSDPYGSPSGSNPYGQNPYGQQPPAPQPYGGGGSYGGGGPQGYGGSGGFGGQPPKTDGVSIAALVLSFLCCLAPIGLILGIVGIRRTRGGQRKGRGLAIAAIIIGILMSIVTAVVGAAIFIFADSLVTPGNAKVGQCVNVDEDDGSILLYKKECTEEHDAEIVGVAEVTAENRDEVESSMAGYCAKAIDSSDFAKLTDHLDEINALIEDPDKVSVGDHLVCYVDPPGKLSDPIL
ncbi:MAG TPA: DUF4190 domain-containing protein [Nocardioides sp.]|nr:DUF4190 domain-containing protein [Nocardioides sp.]